jgi:HK97 family phage portal protein
MLGSRVLQASGLTDPLDDRWYQPMLGLSTDAGVAVSAQTVFLCDAVLAAVRFRANAVALCPAKVYVRKGEDREAQPDSPAQRTLRDPNKWQTFFEWSQLNGLRLSTWGNAYNRLVPGPDYFADELWPLDPARTRVVDQRNDGGLVYVHRPPDGVEERLQQEEVLHYKDLSADGYSGIQTYQLIRNIVGIALAAERHMAMFLKKGTRLSGILSTESPLTDVVAKRAEDSWNSRFGDVNSASVGGVAMLGGGFKFTPMAVDHQKAQFMELQNFLVEKILRALGVPGIVVGYQGDKASTYASADAFFEKGGIRHCILPLLVSMEQRDDKVLLPRDGGLFIKRDLGIVERANTKDAFEMLAKASGGPIITRNEARAKLDLNRIDEPGADELLKPANMTDGTEPEPAPREAAPAPAPKPNAPPAPADEPAEHRLDVDAPGPVLTEEQRQAHEATRLAKIAGAIRSIDETAADNIRERAWRIALAAAGRVVRREVAAIKGVNGAKGAAIRFAADPHGWRAWVLEQYTRHAPIVAEALDLAPVTATAYCDGQVAQLLAAGGLEAVETWEQTIPPRLAAIALGE